jgi:hypothetical protein
MPLECTESDLRSSGRVGKPTGQSRDFTELDMEG